MIGGPAVRPQLLYEKGGLFYCLRETFTEIPSFHFGAETIMQKILNFMMVITHRVFGRQSILKEKAMRCSCNFSALVLSFLLYFMLVGTGPVLAESLKGEVQEEGSEPGKPAPGAPLEPLPLPVLKAPPSKLEGQAGKTDDTDSTLKGKTQNDALTGKEDWSDDELKSQKARVAPDGGVLKGSAKLEDGELAHEDPDIQDQQLQVEWDRWRNRFLRAVLSGATETMNNPQEVRFRWDPMKHAMVPPFPMGMECGFSCVITNNRRIQDLEVTASSGNRLFDQAVLDAVKALEGTTILRFPERSKRQFVSQAGGVKTSDHTENQYFKFGDVERYRAPAF
jgi:hypothetical protein